MSHARMMLGALVCVALIGNATAFNHAQKTYLSPRPHGVNTAMEYTTWNQHPYKKQAKSLRSHVQASMFYQHSENETRLGKYFGIGNGSNSFVVGPDGDAITEIDGRYLIHDSGNTADPDLFGTIHFCPEQEACGVRLDWFQCITSPCEKLFFKASAPIVNVTTNVRMAIPDGVAMIVAPAGGTPFTYSLQDFFAGNVNVTSYQPADTTKDINLQSPLNHAKIDGRHSKTGVADLDLSLGYKYFEDEKKHAFFSLDITVPTGNKVRGFNLFEPIYGNGQHFGLGGGIDAGINVWENDKALIKLLGVVRYKYLFENTERRTLSVKGSPFSQYFMAARDQQINTPLFPAANILTMPVKIKPGNQLDALVDFVFHCKKFTIDLGYNLFWRDTEDAWLKSFEEKTYGIATQDYETNSIFDANSTPNGKLLESSDLDIAAIKTPTLFSHKIFAGFGYTCSMYKQYPCSVGLGGSYEFATSNADLENYAIWAKAAFSF